jgi:hypothetical protein
MNDKMIDLNLLPPHLTYPDLQLTWKCMLDKNVNKTYFGDWRLCTLYNTREDNVCSTITEYTESTMTPVYPVPGRTFRPANPKKLATESQYSVYHFLASWEHSLMKRTPFFITKWGKNYKYCTCHLPAFIEMNNKTNTKFDLIFAVFVSSTKLDRRFVQPVPFLVCGRIIGHLEPLRREFKKK